MEDWSFLFTDGGKRKYLTSAERERFLSAASGQPRDTRALCRLLAFTGCRISEATALTSEQLDGETNSVVFRTLKRRRLQFRAVPIPDELMAELMALADRDDPSARLWRWCRQTAWRRVKGTMDAAGIGGKQACPKGLRHAFGIANAENNIPASLTQRWMGHARLETTAIYQQARADEEREFAKRLWARSGTTPTASSDKS